MRTYLSAFLFLFLMSCGPKQAVADQTAKYLSSITAGELKQHLIIVASDEMQGRETGSAGLKKTAEYLIAEYKQIGVGSPATGYLQHVPSAFLSKNSGE